MKVERRNDQQICSVMQTYCDDKRFVQNVRLKIGSVDLADSNNILDRPASEAVLLLEREQEVDKKCLNPCQGSHELNAIWFQDTIYLEGEQCINALQWSAFMERTMNIRIDFTLLSFRIRKYLIKL